MEKEQEQQKAILKTKVFKLGTSYAILVPKALVDTEVIKEGEEIRAVIWGKNKRKMGSFLSLIRAFTTLILNSLKSALIKPDRI